MIRRYVNFYGFLGLLFIFTGCATMKHHTPIVSVSKGISVSKRAPDSGGDSLLDLREKISDVAVMDYARVEFNKTLTYTGKSGVADANQLIRLPYFHESDSCVVYLSEGMEEVEGVIEKGMRYRLREIWLKENRLVFSMSHYPSKIHSSKIFSVGIQCRLNLQNIPVSEVEKTRFYQNIPVATIEKALDGVVSFIY